MTVPTSRHYPVARVLQAHDGDTLKLEVDLGFSTLARVWIRLKNVRAPELSEPTGPTARNDTLGWVKDHAPDGYVAVETFQTAGSSKEISEQRTFIRYVGVVTSTSGDELNGYLRSRGYTDQGA